MNRLLDKDRDLRSQRSADLGAELKRRLNQDSDSDKAAVSTSQVTTRLHRSGHGRWVPGLSLAAFLAFVARYFWLPGSSVALSQSLQPVYRQITFVGDAWLSAISPDGTFIAYVAGGRASGNRQRVMVQDLTGGQPIEVFIGSFIASLRWSPDGSRLALAGCYVDGSWGTFVIPRLGGELSPYEMAYDSLCWSPDGLQIAGVNAGTPRQIHFLDVATGEQKSVDLAGTFEWVTSIDWSPVSGRLLFLTSGGGKGTIWTVKPDGSNQTEVFSSDRRILSPQWSPSGEAVYYLIQTTPPELQKMVLSTETGNPLSPPVRLLSGLELGTSFTVSRQRGRLLYTRGSGYNNLWLAAPSPRENRGEMVTKPLTSGRSGHGQAQISPDGKQIVFFKHDSGTGSMNLFVMPTEGGAQRQITFSKRAVTSPVWSPDGSEIAFAQQGEKGIRVWKVSSAGGVPQEFAGTEVGSSRYVAWAPGSMILYQRPGNRNFYILDTATKQEAPLVKDESVGWILGACSSPDAEKAVVSWNRTSGGPGGLWIISLKDSSETLLREEWASPVGWSKDGGWVYTITQDSPQKILMIQTQGTETRTVWTLPKDADFCSMTSDGQRIIYSISEAKSDVWLVENFR